MDASLVMPQQLTAVQRKAYERLRVGVRELLVEYDSFRQQTLADSVGATQSFVSKVLRGQLTSLPTLERLASVISLHVSQSDRRTLRVLLNQSLRVLRPRGGSA